MVLDIRIIAATNQSINQSLEHLVAAERLRKDITVATAIASAERMLPTCEV
jgi:hypothetical protein